MPNRYEFRVFATRLTRARDLLNRRARFIETEERTDTYFLGNDVGCALKLRDDKAIDIKILVAQEGDYQLWAPAGMVSLPATGAELGRGIPQAPLPALPPDEFFGANELASILTSAGFAPVTIRKTRHRYGFDGALAEFTRITVGSALRLETAAIESEDTGVLDALRARFGIGPVLNESYPEMLMRVLPRPDAPTDGLHLAPA